MRGIHSVYAQNTRNVSLAWIESMSEIYLQERLLFAGDEEGGCT